MSKMCQDGFNRWILPEWPFHSKPERMSIKADNFVDGKIGIMSFKTSSMIYYWRSFALHSTNSTNFGQPLSIWSQDVFLASGRQHCFVHTNGKWGASKGALKLHYGRFFVAGNSYLRILQPYHALLLIYFKSGEPGHALSSVNWQEWRVPNADAQKCAPSDPRFRHQ